MSDYQELLDFVGRPVPGRILDLASGTGELTRRLWALGYRDLVCLDIAPELFDRSQKVAFIQANLDQPLPLKSASFDYIFCREAIEHLVAPMNLLKEMARVLRPGGHIYLTTPNIMSVDSRMKFLLYGDFTHFRDLRTNWESLRRQRYQGHISPVYLWQLLYFLDRHGFRVDRLGAIGYHQEKRPVKRILMAVFAAIIRRNPGSQRSLPPGISAHDLFFGKCLFIAAQKMGK